jgi:hypothetical protein
MPAAGFPKKCQVALSGLAGELKFGDWTSAERTRMLAVGDPQKCQVAFSGLACESDFRGTKHFDLISLACRHCDEVLLSCSGVSGI